MVEALDAEYAVLQTVLLKDELLDPLTVDLGLRPEHFTARNRRVFDAMIRIYDRKDEVTQTAVGYELGRDQDYLAGLSSVPVPNLADFRSYAKVVIQESRWRDREHHLHAASTATGCRDEEAFETAVARLGDSDQDDTSLYLPEQLADEFYDWLGDIQPVGIPTGFTDLDKALAGGLRRGDTTVVAAWSSMGKSVLVDQVLEYSIRHGHTAGLYINEMDHRDRTARTLARHTTVPFHRIVTKDLTADQNKRILDLLAQLSRVAPTIIEIPGWNADRIARHIRKYKWDLAAVDLATRIPARDTSDWDRVSGTLTDAARQSGTHVLLVCQLNQERNKTTIKPPPVARDLRNTGAWFNDATNVMFVHRNQEDIDGYGVPQARGDIRIEKSRHGQMTSIPVVFDPHSMSFQSEVSYDG